MSLTGDVAYSCIHIGRRVSIGVGQHGDDADHDGLHSVNGQPALLWLLVAIFVLSGLMQDRDAHVAILGHCWKNIK